MYPYPQDLNGDGLITMMRWQDPDGDLTISSDDPRLLVRRKGGDKGPFYRQAVEGIIHDWDHTAVRDSAARVDFNRTWPANFEPFWSWIGMERYALADPETRVVADFALAHPEIMNIIDYHTGNPLVWPAARAFEGSVLYKEDQELYRTIGERGVKITGFPYQAGCLLPARVLPGVQIDWHYEHRGSIAFIIELGVFYNYVDIPEGETYGRPQGVQSDLALLAWDDAHPEVRLFFDWIPYEHPQLGAVELGGWNNVLWGNAPPNHVNVVLGRAVDFTLELIEFISRLEIQKIRLERVEGNTYKLTATVANTGPAPTSVTRRGEDVYPRDRPVVHLDGPELHFVVGEGEQQIGHLGPRGRHELVWVVRAPKGPLILQASTRRGLHAKKVIELKAE